MNTEVAVYCDESGNSGANYLDPEQPFYVLGGWMVPTTAIVEATVAVEKIRQECCPQREELKAAVFLKNEHRKRDAVALFKALGDLGCSPLIVAAEKRYCVAGKVVETFLDPAFNKKLRPGFTSDTLTKRELANTLLSALPGLVLDHFAEAYRHPSSEAFMRSLKEVAESVKDRINLELCTCIEGSLPEIVAIAESEDPSGSTLGKISQSVNLPVLMAFLLLVENLGRIGAIKVAKVVHDEQTVFQDGMKELYRLHRNAEDFVVEFPHSEVLYSNLAHVPALELASSRHHALIQASDVLAGVVNHLMIVSSLGGTPSEGDAELSRWTIPAFFISEPHVAWLIASKTLQTRLMLSYVLPSLGEKSMPPKRQRSLVVGDGAVFPVAGNRSDTDQSSRELFKVDFPLFGILGKESGALMMVNTGPFQVEGQRFDGVATLFTSREKAESLLKMLELEDLSEPQELKEFGAREIPLLVGLLERAMETVKILVVDAGQDEKARKYLDLKQFILGMKQSVDRVGRIFASGFDSVLVQRHDVAGKQVLTMLASNGKYAACIPSDGHLYGGDTREAALKALMVGEGLIEGTKRPETQTL